MSENYKWERPNRKMTMEELWARFEYDPDYVDEDPAYERAFYDRYGNPTYGTLCALYEKEHNMASEPMTLTELFSEFAKWRAEIKEEQENEKYAMAK